MDNHNPLPPTGWTRPSRFPMDPFPEGWYVVRHSEGLAAGEAVPLHYFGRDFVLFRTRSGRAYLLDAFCPHLGAHLGYGGRVAGETIQCPFHAWRLDGSGRCVATPQGEPVPDAAMQAHSWPVREEAGLVFMYWHPERKAPSWQVGSTIPFGEEGWTDPEWVSLEINTHVQEVLENAIDIHHFAHVHGWHAAANAAMNPNGPVLQIVNHFQGDQTKDSAMSDSTEMNLFGLGLVLTRTAVRNGLESFLVTLVVPIDVDRIEVQIGMATKKIPDSDVPEQMLSAAVERLARFLAQDAGIMAHKKYLDDPALTDSESGIRVFRQWARQFYRPLASSTV
jgi:3-ketosteroid 9alpha-monooxygenase subunit A